VLLESYDAYGNKTSKKIRSLEANVLYSPSLLISGGNGIYTAKSSDETVANVSIDDKYLHITTHKMGKFQITITDSDLESLILPVTVTEGSRDWTLWNMKVHIKTQDDSKINESVLQGIANEIKENAFPEGTTYKFIYNLPKEGKLEITVPNKKDIISGTFTIEEKKDEADNYLRIYKLNYNGVEHIYNDKEYVLDLNNLRTSISTLNLIADHTEEYQKKYPDLKLTEVYSMQFCY